MFGSAFYIKLPKVGRRVFTVYCATNRTVFCRLEEKSKEDSFSVEEWVTQGLAVIGDSRRGLSSSNKLVELSKTQFRIRV
jgi:hypothetical protein